MRRKVFHRKMLKETKAVYCKSHMKHTNTLCGQNADFLYFKAGGAYSKN
jgi:hypothetical protein